MASCRNMGLEMGLEKADMQFKRKFRWMFSIPSICGDVGNSDGNAGVNALPPTKSARPNLSFKEAEVQHLTEIVYFPVKVEWKPINLTLYDFKKNKHPIFEWIKKMYDPEKGIFKPVGEGFKKDAKLELYDGCGQILEKWQFDNAWPQSIEFGELDMSNNDVVLIDIVLRYDRAYIVET